MSRMPRASPPARKSPMPAAPAQRREYATDPSFSVDVNDEPRVDDEEDVLPYAEPDTQEYSQQHEEYEQTNQHSTETSQVQAPFRPLARVPLVEDAAAPLNASLSLPSSPTLGSVPSSAAAVPATGAVTIVPKKRLLDAGLAAMKQTLVPGLLLQCVALLIIISYYSSDSAQASFNRLAEFKNDAGYAFSAVSTSIFGGLLPTLIGWGKKKMDERKRAKALALTQGLEMGNHADVEAGHAHAQVGGEVRSDVHDAPIDTLQLDAASAAGAVTSTASGSEVTRSAGGVTVTHRGPTPQQELIFNCLFWMYKGIEVDAFYRLQGIIWGTDSAFGTIVCKVMFDQFVYGPPWATPSCLAMYKWRDSGFQTVAVWRSVWTRHFWLWEMPQCSISGWMVWIPAVSMIYALPASLQIPLFNIVLCFWALVLNLIAGS